MIFTIIAIITIGIYIAFIILLSTAFGINKTNWWLLPAVALLIAGVAAQIHLTATGLHQKPQIVAEELGINPSQVNYDAKSKLWKTDNTSYHVIFTNTKYVKTESGIEIDLQLESLVEIGENVIK